MRQLDHVGRIVLTMGLAVSCMAHAQDGALSPKDLQSVWVGRRLSGVIAAGPLAGRSVNIEFKADGSSAIQGAINDTGAWRFNETGYCNAWKTIRNGAEACFKVVRKGSELHVLNDNGSLNTTVTRVE